MAFSNGYKYEQKFQQENGMTDMPKSLALQEV
jgi:hypothetical protein